jgi:hypothetical protein
MRLFQSLPDTPHTDRRVYCYACNRLHPIGQTIADLDGPAYAAYYCQPCAEKLIATTIGE